MHTDTLASTQKRAQLTQTQNTDSHNHRNFKTIFMHVRLQFLFAFFFFCISLLFFGRMSVKKWHLTRPYKNVVINYIRIFHSFVHSFLFFRFAQYFLIFSTSVGWKKEGGMLQKTAVSLAAAKVLRNVLP